MKKVLMFFLIVGISVCLFANGQQEKATVVDDNATLEMVLLTKDSTTSGFAEWIKKVEEACNLKITVIATPTNSTDRQAKITTILSTGDSSVDIITVNDEMYSAFKNTGWLEKLNTVMTPELIKEYPTAYLKDSVITADGSIYSVPMYFSALGWFVNRDIMKELGYEDISTWEKFESFITEATNDTRFGFGDAWDPTYVYNSLGSFINLFGGDYYDWNNSNTQKGVKALLKILNDGNTTKAQMADQYDQLVQNMVSGNRAVGIMYTNQIGKMKKISQFVPEGPIDMVLPPVADENVGATAYCSSWHYVLNASSKNKQAAMRFLKYAASEQGQLDYTMTFGTYPAYLSLLTDSKLDNLTGIDAMRSYVSNVTLHGRPIVPQSMEFISDIGNLFHKLVLGQITESDFYKQAQIATDKYTK